MIRLLRLLRKLLGTDTPRCSAIWLRDHLRREGAAGIEQSCIAWPVETVRNNDAAFNTRTLRQVS